MLDSKFARFTSLARFDRSKRMCSPTCQNISAAQMVTRAPYTSQLRRVIIGISSLNTAGRAIHRRVSYFLDDSFITELSRNWFISCSVYARRASSLWRVTSWVMAAIMFGVGMMCGVRKMISSFFS